MKENFHSANNGKPTTDMTQGRFKVNHNYWRLVEETLMKSKTLRQRVTSWNGLYQQIRR